MAIPLSEYKRIFSRPGRRGPGDEGFELTPSDEKALNRAWAKVAEEDGVQQLPNQPSRDEIKNFKS